MTYKEKVSCEGPFGEEVAEVETKLDWSKFLNDLYVSYNTLPSPFQYAPFTKVVAAREAVVTTSSTIDGAGYTVVLEGGQR